MANNAIAYGFTDLTAVMAERALHVGEGVILDAVKQSAAEHTRALNSLLGTLCQRTTKGKELVLQVAGGEMQPLDEKGNPIPVAGVSPIEAGYPIFGGGTAWATDRVSRAYMTVDDANKKTIEAMGRDMRTMRRRFLASVLDNASWTFTDTALELGSLTVLPLANGDTQTYLRTGGGTASTDDHYLAQAAAIADAANPFPTIYAELAEHPGNGTDIVCYCPTNLITTIEGLADFVPVKDAYVIPAMTSATLPGSSTDYARIQGAGDEVCGRVSKCWIVEWKALPNSYIFAHALNAGPVCAMREHVPASLQGLIVENNSPDGNITETRMLRYAGFGVRNRVSALCYYIGNASYSIPSGYDAPLAV
jgi:hypothetical protein